MSGAVEVEAPRPRPLSGGLWTLFSWLRRDDHSSSESLSSVGSDRTAASFAFLPPAHYDSVTPAPLPPPGPPTDSYKKRVRDRNLRRQHDRDITLHRKYGLYGFGYDAFSLPNGRRAGPVGVGDRCERERRATSESPRAHVPGKRRAPLPPAATTSLTRRRARKRPAPPPPIKLIHDIKEHIDEDAEEGSTISMNPPAQQEERISQSLEGPSDCKPGKCIKKETKESKDVKIRHEKSFLKQIFENRKRNSAIETSTVKLLPNISELDKQAAEIIEKYRLKEMTPGDSLDKIMDKNDQAGSSKRQTEAWICTRCLRRYDGSVITCNYCLPVNKANDSYKGSKLSNHSTQTNGNLNNSTSRNSAGRAEDKEKLKEMLKEMKDSLPKRPKSDQINVNKYMSKATNEQDDYPKIVDAPTLRIGSSISMEERKPTAKTSSPSRFSKEETSSHLISPNIKPSEINTNAQSSYAGRTSREAFFSQPYENKKETKEKSSVMSSLSPSSSSKSPSTSEHTVLNENKELATMNNVLITKPVVFVHTKESNVIVDAANKNKGEASRVLPVVTESKKSVPENPKRNIIEGNTSLTGDPKPSNIATNTKYDLNTPLKISSLLNPIYIPKLTPETNAAPQKQKTEVEPKNVVITKSLVTDKTAQNINTAGASVSQIKATTSNQLPKADKEKDLLEQRTKVENEVLPPMKNVSQIQTDNKPEIVQDKFKDENKLKNNLVSTPQQQQNRPTTSNVRIDQHTRRRDLIHQLEQSIAKGDEEAAAEAAIKLAQLRLYCSVLSFSSQIVAGASTSSPTPQQSTASQTNNELKVKKVAEVTQKSSLINTEPKNAAEPKTTKEVIIEPKVKEIPKPVQVENKNIVKVVPNPITPKLEAANKNKPVSEEKTLITQNSSQPSTSKGDTKIENDNEDVPVLVWVEDKDATRGPVQLHVRRNAVMDDLRKQAEKSLGLAVRMQRWIVGRSLCSDYTTPLVTLAGPELTAPFYLCLVETDTKDIIKPNVEDKVNEGAGNVYNELVRLEQQALVSNAEVFECGICIEECLPGNGVVLRECIHSFCKECLSDVVRHSEEPVVACPAMGCNCVLEEREIRGLVTPEDYEKWLARGLAAAESGTRNAFHCRTRDCTGWALCDPGVQRFPCPVCKRTNCVPCQAIHEGETCEQHRKKLKESAASPEASQTDEGTRALLNSLISRGEALECPECSAIITKKWGCDWVKCSACKTEICWVTKGRRWGPAGRGDTSAGCRCGVDGKRCHPSCGYCH